MYIKYKDFDGEVDIEDYTFTPEGNTLLNIDSHDVRAPQFVRLSVPEVGGIILKSLMYITRR